MSADIPNWAGPEQERWDRAAFVEEMGLLWEAAGAGRMDGRVIAHLLITDVPYVSSAELARALRVSGGSVSLVTRRLADAGFLRRHAVPGERSHYFRVDDDVWGSFLAGERRYLDQQEQLAERALALLGPDEDAPRRRLRNMRDYMRWIRGSHHDLLARWKEYQSQSLAADAGTATTDAAETATHVEGTGSTTAGLSGAAPAAQGPEAGGEEIPDRLTMTLSPMLAQHLLPDVLWGKAEPLLPSSSRSERERVVLTAVVYVLSSGCGWQQLPQSFGVSPATAHRRFTSWSRAGFWSRWLHSVGSGDGISDAGSAHVEWCTHIAAAALERWKGSNR